MTAEITLREVSDVAALESPWRDLEQRSAGSFFQRWTWVGCLAGERYSRPVLLEARTQGRLVALALFNRRPARFAPATLFLNETGDPALDAVFVEHNGPLIEAGHEALLAPCLEAALAGTGARGRAVVLSGVGDAVLAAARSLPAACHVRRSRPAPFVDLAALGDGEFAATLGASTRYQLRRSRRRYSATGELSVRRAADAAEGLAFLDALATLHQQTWTGRGQRGAFADPNVMRFHRELVASGLPRGELDLLRIDAGVVPIGYLYNLLTPGWAGNYQGGFDYARAQPHQKPGLTCHDIAIDLYRSEGRAAYDFLAGEDRYKASLAGAHTRLHWLELLPARSMRRFAVTGRARVQQIVSRRGRWVRGAVRFSTGP